MTDPITPSCVALKSKGLNGGIHVQRSLLVHGYRLDPTDHIIDPLLNLDYIPPHNAFISLQTGFGVFDSTLKLLKRLPNALLLFLEAFERALERCCVGVQSRERAKTSQNMRDVGEQWRETRQDRRERVHVWVCTWCWLALVGCAVGACGERSSVHALSEGVRAGATS